jgi:SAM-dependent methyltransferase
MTCPLCEYDGPAQQQQRFEPYAVVRCPRCGLSRLQPQPSAAELLALYDDPAYFLGSGGAAAGYRENYAELQNCLRNSFQHDLDFLARYAPRGELLEVGCGYGTFLELARARGYEVRGLEVSADAAAHAEGALGDLVVRSTLEQYSAAHPGSADVLYCSHVIEHVPDPRLFAAAAARVLRPGGWLICVTPNQHSLLARLSGRRWVSYKIPEHLFFFDPLTLGRLLAPHFDLLRVDPAWQFYPLPMVADRLRRLLDPLSRIIPRIEHWPALARRALRVHDGSMRALARRK